MNWTRSHVATVLNKRVTSVFALTWFSFAWFFSSVIPLISDVTRSGSEWLARGVFAGFFVGAITAYFEYRRERKQLAEASRDEELEATVPTGNLVEQGKPNAADEPRRVSRT